MFWAHEFENVDSLSYEVLRDEQDSDVESMCLTTEKEEAFLDVMKLYL